LKRLYCGKPFLHTTAPGIIMVLIRTKKKGQVLLINSSKLFEKADQRISADNSIAQIAYIYLHWKEQEGVSKIIKLKKQ